jgi:hypothetical protein
VPLGEQAGLAQHAEVLRDRWPGDLGKVRCNLARRTFDITHQTQDRPTTRIGEGVEDRAVKHPLI